MSNYPANYNLWNNAVSKPLNVVCVIDQVPGSFSSSLTYDNNLVLKSDNKQLLMLDQSSLDISQVIEPEQGKGSVSTITLVFLDKNQEFTRICAPGVVVDDILGKEISLYLGYSNTRFIDDYYRIFRGYISEVYGASGVIRLSIADPNSKRRSAVFNPGNTDLSGNITNAQTTIPVVDTSSFAVPILGPNGGYDPGVQCVIQVNAEYMFYNATGFTPTQFTVTRGQLISGGGVVGTAAAIGDAVMGGVILTDHSIDMALKVMLSGWNGNWLTGVAVLNLGVDLSTANITLPVGIDANRDYGLVVGDYITTTGATNVGNNQTFTIIGFLPLNGELNRIIQTSTVFIAEPASPAAMAFRSQYDVYPVSCGLKMTPKDVDVLQHLYIKTTFINSADYSYQFLLQSVQSGKDWIESQIYLPYSMYSITRFGKCSVGITEPPLGGQDLQFLNGTNILNAESLNIKRSTINRRFYNEIDIDFDMDNAQNPQTLLRYLDTNSLNIIGTLSTLPITSNGGRTSLNSDTAFNARADKLLNRFKDAAVEIEVKVKWQQGSKIEVGDVVALQDDILHLCNFATGARGLGVQLFEVIKRTLSIKTGSTTLTLLGGVGGSAYDRFGTIGPSSEITSVGPNYVIIVDSFFTDFPGNEQAKWLPYIGQEIRVHDPNWTYQGTFTLVGFDPANPYKMLLNGTVPAFITGLVVDMPEYPSSPYPYFDGIWKTIHCFFDPQVTITANSADNFRFFVSLSDIGKFFPNSIVSVHTDDYVSVSAEAFVLSTDSITGEVIVNIDLGFSPTTGMLVDLVGFFPDQQPPYRII